MVKMQKIIVFVVKMYMNIDQNDSVDKTVRNSQRVSCFQYQIVLKHIAIFDRQMPTTLFNNFIDNLFYFVKRVT